METAFCDLPHDSYPFTLEAISTETGDAVWTAHFQGPGRITIPALARAIGCPVAIRMTGPDGTVSTHAPVRHFICGLCGQETEATQTDMEAIAEFERNYFHAAVNIFDCELVCDSCYFGRSVVPGGGVLRPQKL